ncbi:phosphonate ABC transporter ATP-binding protein [Alkalihalobacillus sp. AL-G]|uniref:phosphonate ABC transporter ATP-binding protein n=1 Tax=Alkalihalobacillus sp. AL-G TaxID=2926399 RepID=UPI00272A1AB8|nr:phosphonate ABC transporter ATP-binding protein [Alkalihalobacillus sp. AL-G]WLD95268.1 phosphonate ABC transporter ATP-binding protein [Alkalihalobacillus sp. AL-G]
MKREPVIKVKNLTVRYLRAKTDALSEVDIELHEGEFICVLGKSGAGKSTLIRCLNGLQKPTVGHVFYNGNDITVYGEEELRKVRTEMGMIFQHFNLIPRLSVMQNVLTGTFGKRPDWKNLLGLFTKNECSEAISLIEEVGLSDHVRQRVEHLSGGQKQRVAIARALIQSPQVFLGDEPVASLDPGTANRIFQILGRIHEEHQLLTLINVHDVVIAKRYASRILALKEGSLIFDGTADDLTEDILEEIYEERG